MYVCLKLNNSGTAGPIGLNFFLLALSWSRDDFRLKKFRIRDLVFPMIRKTRFWREIINYFCKKYLNFHVENRRNNSAKRLYKFCSVFYLFYLSLSTIDSTYLCIKDVSIGHVDCTADDNLNRALCDGQGVNGFPTLNIYKSGICL